MADVLCAINAMKTLRMPYVLATFLSRCGVIGRVV